MKRNRGETNVEVIAGNDDHRNDYTPAATGQDNADALSTYIGGGFSMSMDIYGDIYIMNQNDNGNLFIDSIIFRRFWKFINSTHVWC